jgi:tetratricopeptide (TPR) repeat protein
MTQDTPANAPDNSENPESQIYRRILVTISAFIALVLIGSGFMSLSEQQQYVVFDLTPPTPEPTPLRSPPFKDKEVGVVIAGFMFDVNSLAGDIGQEVLNTSPHVIQLGDLLSSKERAQAVADVYNASYVVWGRESSEGKRVHILVNDPPTDIPYTFDLHISTRVGINVAGQFIAGLRYFADNKPLNASYIFENMMVGMPNELALTEDMSMVYFFRALSYHQVGNYDNAVVDLNTFVELQPLNPYGYYHRGNAHRDLGLYPFAIADYEQAIELDDDFAPAYLGVGSIYALLGDDTNALLNFDKAIELEPRNPESYYQKALIYSKNADYRNAIRSYEAVLAVNPKHDRVYLSLAQLHENLNQTETALEYYFQALRLAPSDPLVIFQRGLLYLKIEDYEHALLDLNRTLDLAPQDIDALYTRGLIYYGQQELDLAFESYSEVIQLDPNYTRAYVERGRIYYDNELYDRALEALDKAIMIDPEYAPAYYLRGLTHYADEEYTKTLIDLMEVTWLTPEDARAYYEMGNTYVQFDKSEVAIENYTRAIENDNSQPEFYEARGLSYAEDETEADNALADFITARDLYTENAVDVPEWLLEQIEKLSG